MKEKIIKWMCQPKVMFSLWCVIGLLSAITKMSPERHNNYDIFRYVFYNTWSGSSLYAPSIDGGFYDMNHYGPFFSLIIAPFAIMPVQLGLLFWCTLLAIFLYWAVDKYSSLQVPAWSAEADKMLYIKPIIIWFCAHELLTALFMQQFNVAIAAILLLSFYFVEKEKDQYATLFIVIGTLVKLYGIVGVAFFFFSRHKLKFVLSFIGWSVLLFCLPMIISSPEYQISQYHEWYISLSEKNVSNFLGGGTNISLLGMIRKIGYSISEGREQFLPVMHNTAEPNYSNWWMSRYSDLWVILLGMITMSLGYFRLKQWKCPYFRHAVLAAVMMFVCLFSTGTESSGYIIALIGCSIWYWAAPWKRSKMDAALMVFAFVITSMSPSDLFPRYLRNEIIQPYALKALPVVIIWMKLCYELITKDYDIARQADECRTK